jgi:hypothetical protein
MSVVSLPEKGKKLREVCRGRAENNMRSAGEGQKFSEVHR